MKIIDNVGRSPYAIDTSRTWVEGHRNDNGLLQPQTIVRIATDTNYIQNRRESLYSRPAPLVTETKAIMNVALPGMKIPAILNWQVDESADSIVQTASFEAVNALPVSDLQTTLETSLPARKHNTAIKATYAANSMFEIDKVTGVKGRPGNNAVSMYEDRWKYGYREHNVKYRVFESELFTVDDASLWPRPEIPDDDDNDLLDDPEYPSRTDAVGSYFALIGDREVVRVVSKLNNTFAIPAGGRAVNGVLAEHPIGATVKLLGFAPTTGEYCALGYLNLDDYNAQTSILRPGTCFTSYEGYGDLQNLNGTRMLNHSVVEGRNYVFTGYWFIANVQSSYSEDGTPKVKVDLQSTGYMYEKQSINIDLIQRMKNRFGQWRLAADKEDIWGDADHKRNIPGDWVDYHSWDSTLRGSYPLQIKTEYAQHKAYFDHMRDTEMGKSCDMCRQELAKYRRTAPKSSHGSLQEGRMIGRHIYKESIRVMREEAGPIKTYIRLMSTMAAAAWDHPVYGVELAQKFTKIPARLFNNIRNVRTGLIYNGQVEYGYYDADMSNLADWTKPGYSDYRVVSQRAPLSCPFESDYDKAPFSQPMQDLAEINQAVFWVTREGYPVFVPENFSFRPSGHGYKQLEGNTKLPTSRDEWFMSHGGSISGYSHQIESESILTQVWVTATTAFEAEFTVAAAGTGFKNNNMVMYSPLAGNKEGLALTGGVQQIDTVSMDNLMLGMEWDTKIRTQQKISVGGQNVSALNQFPLLFKGNYVLGNGSTNFRKKDARKVVATINWFLKRRYIAPLKVKSKYWYQLPFNADPNGEEFDRGVEKMARHIIAALPKSKRPILGNTPVTNGNYTADTYRWLKAYFDYRKHYIINDVFWYVHNMRSWEEYVTAITGIPMAVKKANKAANFNDKKALTTPNLVLDIQGLQREVQNWMKQFSKQVVNYGNRVVNESIDKATTKEIQSNYADPRIQPGDVIWVNLAGYLGNKDTEQDGQPPFNNGVYITSISRQMDLVSGTYTATYSGRRYRGEFGRNRSRGINKGYDFITDKDLELPDE